MATPTPSRRGSPSGRPSPARRARSSPPAATPSPGPPRRARGSAAAAPPAGAAEWEAVTGPQGTVLTTSRYAMTVPRPVTSWFYRDQTTPPEQQCWGDSSFLGASGPSLTGRIENTDPQVESFGE